MKENTKNPNSELYQGYQKLIEEGDKLFEKIKAGQIIETEEYKKVMEKYNAAKNMYPEGPEAYERLGACIFYIGKNIYNSHFIPIPFLIAEEREKALNTSKEDLIIAINKYLNKEGPLSRDEFIRVLGIYNILIKDIIPELDNNLSVEEKIKIYKIIEDIINKPVSTYDFISISPEDLDEYQKTVRRAYSDLGDLYKGIDDRFSQEYNIKAKLMKTDKPPIRSP